MNQPIVTRNFDLDIWLDYERSLLEEAAFNMQQATNEIINLLVKKGVIDYES